MVDYEPKHLKRWTRPDSYLGAVWPGYYVFLGQHRDSDALTRSNFAEALDALGGENAGETVLVVHESHWAVGWVEWIAIHQDDGKALALADEMHERLEDYPVLNEEAFSDLEYSEACEYWERMRIRERAEVCKRFGISIFAARRSEIPQDDDGSLVDYLRA